MSLKIWIASALAFLTLEASIYYLSHFLDNDQPVGVKSVKVRENLEISEKCEDIVMGRMDNRSVIISDIREDAGVGNFMVTFASQYSAMRNYGYRIIVYQRQVDKLKQILDISGLTKINKIHGQGTLIFRDPSCKDHENLQFKPVVK